MASELVSQFLARREHRNRGSWHACPLPSRRPRNSIPIEYRTIQPIGLNRIVRQTRKSRLSYRLPFPFLVVSSRNPGLFRRPGRFRDDLPRSRLWVPSMTGPDRDRQRTALQRAVRPRTQRAARTAKITTPPNRSPGRSRSLFLPESNASHLAECLGTGAGGSSSVSSRHTRCALTSCRRLSAWSDIVPPIDPESVDPAPQPGSG